MHVFMYNYVCGCVISEYTCWCVCSCMCVYVYVLAYVYVCTCVRVYVNVGTRCTTNYVMCMCVCVCTRWSNAAGCQHLGHHGELGRVGLAGEADGDARHHQLLARRDHLHATTRAKPSLTKFSRSLIPLVREKNASGRVPAFSS